MTSVTVVEPFVDDVDEADVVAGMAALSLAAAARRLAKGRPDAMEDVDAIMARMEGGGP